MGLRHQPVLRGAGEHACNFLPDWKGKLIYDDFGGETRPASNSA
ncbi:hypothetical protein C4K39_5009 [Pseudomonas sessilinigenes]|nr:hypothetical protein C4K39_5009 [Pseudomonas sessilinigenes]